VAGPGIPAQSPQHVFAGAIGDTPQAMASFRDKRRDKLVQQAQPALTPGEQVIDATTGLVPVRRMGSETVRNGIVLVTDRRVVLFTKKLGGYDMQDFAFGLLSSVDHKKGLMYGELDLAAAGDRNHVKQMPKDDVERIARLIRDKMAAAHQGGQAGAASSAPAPAQAGPATEIRNLAALRDEGLITPEEFEAKKKQLLGL
jgi:hypothetical protein